MAGKTDPFGDLERLFEEFMTTRPSVSRTPPIDVVETDEEVLVFVDLPGRDTDAIDVTLEEGSRLTVSAEGDETDIEGRYVTRERTDDPVSRSITLPTAVEETGTNASYDSGVLKVTLPIPHEESGGTEIQVE